MKSVIDHETYGQIVYDESFWLGKKTLMINGKYLTKVNRKTFSYSNEAENKQVYLGGNFLTGAHLTIDQEKIQLTPPIKWYELLLPILVFCFMIIWGSVPSLVLMFPLVGGALGGLIDGVGIISSILAMKSIKRISIKLLAWLGISALTILINFLVATFLIAALV